MRARRQPAYIHPSITVQLRAEGSILAGGRDAANAHGLATGPAVGIADAYITVSDFEQLSCAQLINVDIEPANTLLHIAPDAAIDRQRGAVPLLVAWADLEDAGDRASALVLTALRRQAGS